MKKKYIYKYTETVIQGLLMDLYLIEPKIQPLQKFSSLFRAEPVYEGRVKVILLLQVTSHDFESSFIIFCLNWRILQTGPDKNKTPNLWHVASILVCCIFEGNKCAAKKDKLRAYFPGIYTVQKPFGEICPSP